VEFYHFDHWSGLDLKEVNFRWVLMDIDGNTHKSYKTLKERLINHRIKGLC